MNCVELSQTLTGNGILAFSDPAGAKACLALAFILQKENPGIAIRLVSNKFYTFFNDWSEEVLIITDPDKLSLTNTNWLFTGTSHPDSSNGFELEILLKAKLTGIQTASFIDHRTSLLLRFNYRDTLVFPDIIFLTDEVNLQEAIEAGIPGEKLKHLGNPYLEFLHSHWNSNLSENEFRSFYQIPSTVRSVIVYAPDPISLRHTVADYGFDEHTVLEELLPFFKQHPHLFLLIKPHPLQPLDRIRTILKESELKTVFLDETGKIANPEMMHHSVAVIGFFSNFLVEAHVMGARIFRYFPSKADEFEGIFRNFAVKCSTIDELTHELIRY